MSKKANPALIGAFTLLGLIMTAVAIVLLGAGKYFTTTHEVLLYFDKSANGLQTGSDVRFGGVRIGRVKSITVLVDREENRKVIPVVVELGEKELRLISTEEGGGIDLSTFEGVNKAVSQGLRAGMKQQSLVTGQLYVEFDIVPDTPGFVYHSKIAPPMPVVPTIGTEIDELIAGIADGLRKFNSLDIEGVINGVGEVIHSAQQQIAKLDIEGINDNIMAIAKNVRQLTNDGRLASAVTNLDAALIQIDELAAKANVGIDPLLADLRTLAVKIDAGVGEIQGAASELSSLSNPRAPMLLRLQSLLTETERATRAFKELSADLRRNPRALITGKAIPE